MRFPLPGGGIAVAANCQRSTRGDTRLATVTCRSCRNVHQQCPAYMQEGGQHIIQDPEHGPICELCLTLSSSSSSSSSSNSGWAATAMATLVKARGSGASSCACCLSELASSSTAGAAGFQSAGSSSNSSRPQQASASWAAEGQQRQQQQQQPCVRPAAYPTVPTPTLPPAQSGVVSRFGVDVIVRAWND